MAASKNNKLILASASSRRLNLLEQVKILPDEVYAPQIDESPKKNEAAPNLVRRLALAKADAGHSRQQGGKRDRGGGETHYLLQPCFRR